ncbi:MAG: hypothetical protein JW829_08575, partial [Pirellulales bacterium]|nr:hypothetical protein [Pirellulales bacterium]
RSPDTFQNEEERQKFDSYFTDYIFPSMTPTSPEGLADLGKKRTDFLRDLRSAKYPEIFQHLTNLTCQWWQPIITDTYHPAVRNIGVLLIGDMDENLGDSRADGAPPVPLPAAADFLLSLLAADNDQVPIYLKNSALRGLQRHARYKKGFTPERAQKLIDAGLAIGNQTRPENCSVEGFEWLRSVAAEVLGELGQIGENQSVHTMIQKLVEPGDRSIDSRCWAAKSLSGLKPQYTEGCGVDAVATARVLATLAKEIADAEAEYGKKFSEGQLSEMGGGSMGYGEDVIKFPRQRTLYRLNCVLDAFDAIDAILQEPVKKQVVPLKESLLQLKKLAGQADGIDLQLAVALRDAAPQIGDLVLQIAPPEDASKAEEAEPDLSL